MPPDFDEVQLTPEETEYALYDARCVKYFDLQKQKQQQQKTKLLMEALTPFTTAQLKEYVLKNNPQFRVECVTNEKDVSSFQCYIKDEGRSLTYALR